MCWPLACARECYFRVDPTDILFVLFFNNNITRILHLHCTDKANILAKRKERERERTDFPPIFLIMNVPTTLHSSPQTTAHNKIWAMTQRMILSSDRVDITTGLDNDFFFVGDEMVRQRLPKKVMILFFGQALFSIVLCVSLFIGARQYVDSVLLSVIAVLSAVVSVVQIVSVIALVRRAYHSFLKFELWLVCIFNFHFVLGIIAALAIVWYNTETDFFLVLIDKMPGIQQYVVFSIATLLVCMAVATFIVYYIMSNVRANNVLHARRSEAAAIEDLANDASISVLNPVIQQELFNAGRSSYH